jgi:hypothetical protein
MIHINNDSLVCSKILSSFCCCYPSLHQWVVVNPHVSLNMYCGKGTGISSVHGLHINCMSLNGTITLEY